MGAKLQESRSKQQPRMLFAKQKNDAQENSMNANIQVSSYARTQASIPAYHSAQLARKQRSFARIFTPPLASFKIPPMSAFSRSSA